MSLTETLRLAREQRDWGRLAAAIPFAEFLNLRIDIKGDEFTCILPFTPSLIGNPHPPALHGGAMGGFLECAAVFYLLWHMDSGLPPKTIDFNIDYLRPGRPQDSYANVHGVKLGSRVANVRVEAWQDSPDKPIAIAHGNFLLRA